MGEVRVDAILLGSVGANRFLRTYPLGADFIAGLRAEPWLPAVTVRELDWSPIAIAQEWQASVHVWSRVVLVGPVDRGWPHGTVRTRRWTGGTLTNDAIQQRIYEAVTGVVALDNLLVIGAHFSIWPETVITVEVQLAAEIFGNLVAAEAATSPDHLVGHALPDSATRDITDEVMAECRQAISGKDAWLQHLPELSAENLSPVGEWYRHRAAETAVAGNAP